MKRYIITAIFVTLHYAVYSQNSVNVDEFIQKMDSIHQPKYGDDYHCFSAVTLNGDTITEKQLIGKVTLINLWFEHCAPCFSEAPALNELYLRQKDNPEFQMISFARENYENAKKCVQNWEILYPTCPVTNEEGYRLNYHNGFPTNIIIDAQGKVSMIKVGGSTDKEKAKDEIQKLEEKMKDLFTNEILK